MLRSIVRVAGVLLLLVASPAKAQEATDVSSVLPTATERLPTPIDLAACPGWRVVEWRASKPLGSLTGPTPKGVDALNQLCRRALDTYPGFLKKHALKFEKRDVALTISMMAANTTLDGKDPRNLNDVAGRFKTSVSGCCNWGIYLASSTALYMRNDPVKIDGDQIVIHRMFARTFLHELSHVLLHQWRVRELQPHITRDQDEGLAEEWVRSLGYPYDPESSGEDRIAKAPMLRLGTSR